MYARQRRLERKADALVVVDADSGDVRPDGESCVLGGGVPKYMETYEISEYGRAPTARRSLPTNGIVSGALRRLCASQNPLPRARHEFTQSEYPFLILESRQSAERKRTKLLSGN